MPDTRPNGLSNSSSGGPPEKLQESMRHLKIVDGDSEEGDSSRPTLNPDRRRESDCSTYLRTGSCTYGSRCKYNHPPMTEQGTQHRDQLPKRDGQPDCQFFLRTGICKYGVSCKYNHPQDKHNPQLLQFNVLGLPMRKDEKSCPFYMRTGTCKFGVACKFNHPQPDNFGTMFPVEGFSVYGYSESSAPPMPPYTVGLPWPFSRPPSTLNPPMPFLQAYIPAVLPPTQPTVPMHQGWSTYMVGRYPHDFMYTENTSIPSDSAVGSNQMLNFTHYGQAVPAATVTLPERPDQPECQYYMRTGNCKFGSSCKYHHPKERNQEAAGTTHSLGLPLNPGEATCAFYARNGSCKYGPACKFNHPFLAVYTLQEPSAYQNGYNSRWTSGEDSFRRIPTGPDEPVRLTELPGADIIEDEKFNAQISPSHTAHQSDSSVNLSD